MLGAGEHALAVFAVGCAEPNAVGARGLPSVEAVGFVSGGGQTILQKEIDTQDKFKHEA